MTRYALYSARHERYATGGLGWSSWAADAKLFATPEQAHDYRRLVLRLDDTTHATRPGCYLVHITGE